MDSVRYDSNTYDPKTHSFKQPIFIYRYDPTTKQAVQDEKPLA